MRNSPKYQNAAFEKALWLLAQPISLLALGLILLNDVFFRHLWPSWWTGKLSDFAWLWVAPLVLAAFLAWLIPQHSRPALHEHWIFTLAYILVGVSFLFVKVVPPINLLATRIFTALTGTLPALSLDASDLLALPVILAGVWFWKITVSRYRASTVPPVRVLMALPFTLFILLADAAAPNPGIVCFSQIEGQIAASGGYNNSFISQDGGLHWQAGQPATPNACVSKVPEAGQWQQVSAPQPGTLFRYKPGQEIQLSTDGGQTWQTGLKLSPVSEAERTYYLQSRPGNPVFNPGPLDALADPATGNMLFAMGHQGVLVHTAQGAWVWSIGGEYQRIQNFPDANAFSMLMGGMVVLGLGLALLIFSTLALRWTRHWLRIVVLILAALAWLAVDILFPPAISTSYNLTISAFGILALALFILPLTIEQTVRLARRAPRSLPRLAAISFLGGLLYLLPYLFWLYNLLPSFGYATFVALAVAAVVLAIGLIINHPAHNPSSPAL